MNYGKYFILGYILLILLLTACQEEIADKKIDTEENEIIHDPEQEIIVVPSHIAENQNSITRTPSEVIVPIPDLKARKGEVGLVNAWGIQGERLDLQRKILNINQIRCDTSEGTLTFTLRNPKNLTEGRVWIIDPPVKQGSPSNYVPTQISLNGYQMNSPVYNYYRNGKRMFGPKEKFTDNCGGKTQILEGKVAICSLNNVPLRSKNELGGYNRMFINTPFNQVIFQFTCQE